MRRLFRAGIVLTLGGILIAGLAKSLDIARERGKVNSARLSGKMQTACIGRFLIDMPDEAQLDFGCARIDGFDIGAFKESTDEFLARLGKREAEINAKPDRQGGNKNVELVKEVKTRSGLVGKIFIHSRVVEEGTAGNGLEKERYRYEGIAVEALLHGDGVSIDAGSDFYFPDRLEDFYSVVTRLVPNPRNQAPDESGFCIDRAYIRDLLKTDRHEQISMFAKLPSHPDIDFLLMLAAGIKPDRDGLLKRGAASERKFPILERFRITRLRAEQRQIGGLSGEELVRRVIESNNARVYSFKWEVNGIEDDVLIPHLLFSMTTGKSNDGPVPTSMSERTALGLWDKILSSIRVRPPVPRKPDPIDPGPVRVQK
ncbi:MAG: hypothetical protein EON59_04170 [Alphaproteobacteria bacterium]|nr:MAG: hypothetical protein EON59_04170 [Alphaproteobacteria bacterium]